LVRSTLKTIEMVKTFNLTIVQIVDMLDKSPVKDLNSRVDRELELQRHFDREGVISHKCPKNDFIL
jgi:hypothetical protein